MVQEAGIGPVAGEFTLWHVLIKASLPAADMAIAVAASPDSLAQPDSITEPDNKKAVSKPPPLIKSPYSPKDALDDIPGVAHALDLFLASKMIESEEYCDKTDPKKLVGCLA